MAQSQEENYLLLTRSLQLQFLYSASKTSFERQSSSAENQLLGATKKIIALQEEVNSLLKEESNLKNKLEYFPILSTQNDFFDSTLSLLPKLKEFYLLLSESLYDTASLFPVNQIDFGELEGLANKLKNYKKTFNSLRSFNEEHFQEILKFYDTTNKLSEAIVSGQTILEKHNKELKELKDFQLQGTIEDNQDELDQLLDLI